MIKPIIFLSVAFICYTFLLTNKKRPHKFWNKQPVSRNTTPAKEGIISKTPIFNIDLPKDYSFLIEPLIFNSSSMLNLINFINNNFSDHYKYSKQFLYETLAYPNSTNIQLKHNDKIIGFIHAKPINATINKKTIEIKYVDFLCVHKKFRSKNLAALLISKLLSQCSREQVFIFKKETKSLPFNFINQTSYYYIDTTFLKTTKVNKDTVKFMDATDSKLVYDFITKNSKKYKIFQNFSYEQFVKIYEESKVKQILAEYDNQGNIVGIVIFVEVLFMDSSQPLKTIDIEQIFIDNKITPKIFDGLIEYAKKNGINIISLLDQGENKYFIDKYKMFPSLKLYFHMYNYHLLKPIENTYMGINFL